MTGGTVLAFLLLVTLATFAVVGVWCVVTEHVAKRRERRRRPPVRQCTHVRVLGPAKHTS